MDVDNLSCPECNSDLQRYILQEELPKDFYYCPDCEIVMYICAVKLNLNFSGTTPLEKIGLGVELIF